MSPHEVNRHSSEPTRVLSPLRDFLRTEAAGGTLLVFGTLVALVWANTPWKAAYHAIWDTDFTLALGRYSFGLDLRHWVNDGLMTIFFLVVGLEIKREATTGHLASREKLTLPLVGALGGMVVPALLYLAIAGGEASHGWGVPMATDIALAVGVLSLLGSRVAPSGRAFLLGLAVVDDIGAIVVIAIFYSKGFSATWFLVAVGAIAVVIVMRAIGTRSILAFVPVGAVAWFGLHEAGVHPTIAGVVLGLITPLTPILRRDVVDVEELASGSRTESNVSYVEWLEHLLHPWSSFLIVPLFAFANAGLELSFDALSEAAQSPVAWGVFAGLVVGKPVGVFVLARVATRTGMASLPEGVRSRSLLGLGNAAGIGFTVALFISELAFDNETHRADAKLAILVASLVSAILAAAVLRTTKPAQITTAATAE